MVRGSVGRFFYLFSMCPNIYWTHRIFPLKRLLPLLRVPLHHGICGELSSPVLAEPSNQWVAPCFLHHCYQIQNKSHLFAMMNARGMYKKSCQNILNIASRDIIVEKMEAPVPKKQRGPYRKYLQDTSVSIPKATMWRYKRLQSAELQISSSSDAGDSCFSCKLSNEYCVSE